MGRQRDPNSALSQLDRYVAESPGLLLKEIAEGIGLADRVVAKRLASLMASERVRREGTLGSYRYFPGLNQPGAIPNKCPCCDRKRPAVDEDGHCYTCHKEIEAFGEAFHEGYGEGYAVGYADALAGKPRNPK